MVDLKSGLVYAEDTVSAYKTAGVWTDETPQDWLAQWAESKPEAPAVIAGDRVVSYRDLFVEADTLAGLFGVKYVFGGAAREHGPHAQDGGPVLRGGKWPHWLRLIRHIRAPVQRICQP